MNSARPTAILTRQLRKSYGRTLAVAGLDLDIAEGEFFGLLGRNGSGKTTTLHMLSTLLTPSAGYAQVAGFDTVHRAVAVREHMGLVFQESALDRTLSVEENLLFAAALYGLPKMETRERIHILLDLFDLQAKRKALVASLSGGMRRALDIARGVLHRPRVLLLDEPTIGLDVINRRAIWRFLNRLREQHGMTIVLTTHYLEEATDCDRVVFMHQGSVIGEGVPKQLVRELGAHILELRARDVAPLAGQLTALLGKPLIESDSLQFCIASEDFDLAALQHELKDSVDAMLLRRPDLNDVYVWLNSLPASGAHA